MMRVTLSDKTSVIAREERPRQPHDAAVVSKLDCITKTITLQYWTLKV